MSAVAAMMMPMMPTTPHPAATVMPVMYVVAAPKERAYQRKNYCNPKKHTHGASFRTATAIAIVQLVRNDATLCCNVMG